jgi:hypothetical protein
MIEELHLWDAQVALLAALEVQPVLDRGGAGEVALDLGFPTSIQPQHVWIDGGASGQLACELTGTRPSDETFQVKVFVFVQMAADYADVAARLKVLSRAVGDALASSGFAAAVGSWSIPQYRIDAGTDGSNRQLCLELTIECSCW